MAEDVVLSQTSINMKDSFMFSREDHYSNLLYVMHDMFRQGQLTDVTLCVAKSRVRCHRNVMAAISPYFQVRFSDTLS